jgi:integrase/recombinase XerC
MNDLPARADRYLPRGPAPRTSAREVYEAFLRRRSKNTLDAYRRDLAAFATWRELDNGYLAAEGLLAFGLGHANKIVAAWRDSMVEAKLAPSTINRRLASLRSLTKLARQQGLVVWELEVENVPSRKYRDTSGPGAENVKRLLAHAGTKDTMKGRRDCAMLHLLFGLGLRRFEVVNLDLEHVDFGRKRLEVTGKGRTEPEQITMSTPVVSAIQWWLELRGTKPGPLFGSLDPAGKGDGRLDGGSLRRIVRKLGKQIGIDAWPHGLRHAGVTAVLDATDGDVRAAQRFARHVNVNTTMIYDDNRQDLGGAAAEKMAEYMEKLGEDEGEA